MVPESLRGRTLVAMVLRATTVFRFNRSLNHDHVICHKNHTQPSKNTMVHEIVASFAPPGLHEYQISQENNRENIDPLATVHQGPSWSLQQSNASSNNQPDQDSHKNEDHAWAHVWFPTADGQSLVEGTICLPSRVACAFVDQTMVPLSMLSTAESRWIAELTAESTDKKKRPDSLAEVAEADAALSGPEDDDSKEAKTMSKYEPGAGQMRTSVSVELPSIPAEVPDTTMLCLESPVFASSDGPNPGHESVVRQAREGPSEIVKHRDALPDPTAEDKKNLLLVRLKKEIDRACTEGTPESRRSLAKDLVELLQKYDRQCPQQDSATTSLLASLRRVVSDNPDGTEEASPKRRRMSTNA
jgi:hypothetical protein